MSGLASGIGKVFSTVGKAAARVSQAVLGVGATTFTAGAASGAAPMATGGFGGVLQSLTGGGVLGNVLTGAIKQAGYGALIGGAIGAMTGQGFGKGAMIGGLGGAVSGGLMSAAGIGMTPATPSGAGTVPADTPTGFAPTGSTDPASARVAAAHGTPTIYTPDGGMDVAGAGAPAAAPASGGGGGFGQFLQSEAGGSLIAGIGKGMGDYALAKMKMGENQKDRDFERDREQRLQDSYDVDPAALHGAAPVDDTQRPTPAEKYNRQGSVGKFRYEYSPEARRIVRVPA